MNLVDATRLVIRHGRGHLHVLVFCLLLVLFESLLGSLALVSLLPAVNAIINPGTIGAGLPVIGPILQPYLASAPLLILLVLACLLMMKAVVSFAMDVCGLILGERLRVAWTERMMLRYLRAPLDDHAASEDGALISNILELPRGGQGFVVALTGYASLALQALGVLVAMLFVRWEVLVGGVAVAIIALILLRKPYHSRAARLGKDNIVYHQLTAARIVETMRGVRDIKLLGLGEVIRRKLHKHLVAHKKLQLKVRILQRLPNETVEFGIGAVVLAIYFFAASLSEAELKAVLPEAVFFLVGFQRAMSMGASLASQNFKLINNYQRLSAMSDLLDGPDPETESSGEAVSRLPAGALTGVLVFEDVSYSYPNGAVGMRNISVSIPLGKITYIFGPSGCGKSTLLDLATRLRQPKSGRIHLNGADISRFPLREWMNMFGYISQDPTLLSGSIRDNIALFDATVPLDRIVAVSRSVGADDFICRFPDGYDTLIRRSGGTLSGGQRRRIAIARCLLRNPRILVLDEALTALEEGAERELIVRLRANFPQLTIIVVSHRSANTELADSLLEFKAGQIIVQERQHPTI